MITVKSNLKDKSKVAFWEQHKAHPDGEVFVTGEGEFQVARTTAVIQAIGQERIVEVGKTKEETLATGQDEGKALEPGPTTKPAAQPTAPESNPFAPQTREPKKLGK